MAVITPPTLTPAPTSPDRSDRTTFSARAIALDEWTKNSQVPQMLALGANVYANAVDAATSANAANTSASGAYASAGVATTQAGIATTQAGYASTSATNAENSRLGADKRYLGAKSTAPTLDNQGAALQTGAVYYDTTLAKVRTWTGSAWVEGISAVAGVSSVNGASGAVTVQPTLVSGTNIKTVNGNNLMGSGDLVVAGGVTSFNGLTGAVSYAAQDLYVYGVRIGLGGGAVATNTASGYNSLGSNTTGDRNTASGSYSLIGNTTGANNTASGSYSMHVNTTGSYNTANGCFALPNNTTGTNNTAFGCYSLYANITGAGNIGIGGINSSGSIAPVFNVSTESNRVVMGSTAVTNAYIQVAWTVVSDARDKTDFAPVPHGLDFVCALKPTAYKFRKSRDSLETDGPVRYGFKAQDVLELEGRDSVIVDSDDADKLRFNDSSLIPVLVKAIQELYAEFNAYKASHP